MRVVTTRLPNSRKRPSPAAMSEWIAVPPQVHPVIVVVTGPSPLRSNHPPSTRMRPFPRLVIVYEELRVSMRSRSPIWNSALRTTRMRAASSMRVLRVLATIMLSAKALRIAKMPGGWRGSGPRPAAGAANDPRGLGHRRPGRRVGEAHHPAPVAMPGTRAAGFEDQPAVVAPRGEEQVVPHHRHVDRT